ncbi:pantoate kinase [Haloplanus aerogenes]|uniref:Pantoate kinase n=1 Tax=Haloplanus aerogenes TaxID=660522 RepID=A0A3M0DPP4_9EURY|nr:pantoate kinase [Haloplanus aerogenes]AZH24736.1 sugar kinase [Haloplanus aerogenes]RMB23604.1 pantoate kinase [Haloplanus aerogenes]
MTDPSTAFVPGHVTGFFSPCPADDPARAGSRGAGLTLTDGVRVTVREAADADDGPLITLDGDPLSMPPVEAVLGGLDVSDRARVVAESDLPLGTGFGVSGAMALGTALAANDRFGCERSVNDLVTLAHCAEVEAGTGLGDVVAQARGGVPIRLDPGAPGHGRLDGVPAARRVEYLTFGDLSTAEVLAGDTDPLVSAGAEALDRLVDRPTLPTLVAASRRFARDAGLLTDRVCEVVDAVTAADGEASMVMLGETVFALDLGLSDAGFDADACRTCDAGAHLVD